MAREGQEPAYSWLRFGEVVSTYQAHVPGQTITCLTPALGPGFVIVGYAVRTGTKYAPVRDDISLENGANMFEFAQPWRAYVGVPDETYASGGQLLFIQGQDIRPELRCAFVDNSPTGATIHFVSSTLVVCEAEEFKSKSSGVLSCSTTHITVLKDNRSPSNIVRYQ